MLRQINRDAHVIFSRSCRITPMCLETDESNIFQEGKINSYNLPPNFELQVRNAYMPEQKHNCDSYLMYHFGQTHIQI